VAVETGRGHLWGAVAQAAGGGQPCLTVHPLGRIGPQGATVAAPVLVVRDCGPRPARTRLSASPWQTVLTVLPYLGAGSERLLTGAQLVGVQRVSPQEAAAVAKALTLPEQEERILPSLGDGVTLWATRTDRTLTQSGPTAAEAQVLGPARRMD
jgi:hypothetical protein